MQAAASGDVSIFKFLTRIYLDEFQDPLAHADNASPNASPVTKTRESHFRAWVEKTAFDWYAKDELTDGTPTAFSPDQCELIKKVQLELKKHELVLTHADNFGRTCMHLAVQHGKHEMVQHIIDLAEDVYRQMPESKYKENRSNKALLTHIDRMQDQYRSA